MQKRPASVHYKGFTLLELLLAISISVIISAGAYQVLTASANAISTAKNLQSKLQPLQDLQWYLRRDLHSMVRASATNHRSPLSALNLESLNPLSLFIPRTNQTSFLLYNDAITTYTNNADEGLARTLQRTKMSNDPAIRHRTDTLEFEGISLLKMDPGQDHGVSPKQSPFSLRMTVEDWVLGEVTLEFGIQ